MSTALCTNFAGIAAQRFFLGCLESVLVSLGDYLELIADTCLRPDHVHLLAQEGAGLPREHLVVDERIRWRVRWSYLLLYRLYPVQEHSQLGESCVRSPLTSEMDLHHQRHRHDSLGHYSVVPVPVEPSNCAFPQGFRQGCRRLSSQVQQGMSSLIERQPPLTSQTGTRNAIVKKYQIIEALDPRKDPQGILLFFSTSTLCCCYTELTASLLLQRVHQRWLRQLLLPHHRLAGLHLPRVLSTRYRHRDGPGPLDVVGRIRDIPLEEHAYLRCHVRPCLTVLGYQLTRQGRSRTILHRLCAPDRRSGRLQQHHQGHQNDGCLHDARVRCHLCLDRPTSCAERWWIHVSPASSSSKSCADISRKRTTLTSLAFLGYSVGNICGPHVFYPGQTPTYLTGFVADLVCFAFQWSLLYTLRVVYKRENARRDREFGIPVEEDGDAFTDLTDRENMSFRCECH